MTLLYLCCTFQQYLSKLSNNDLQKISEWAYKWKISFNPDLNKPAQEVIFSKKLNKHVIQKLF